MSQPDSEGGMSDWDSELDDVPLIMDDSSEEDSPRTMGLDQNNASTSSHPVTDRFQLPPTDPSNLSPRGHANFDFDKVPPTPGASGPGLPFAPKGLKLQLSQLSQPPRAQPRPTFQALGSLNLQSVTQSEHGSPSAQMGPPTRSCKPPPLALFATSATSPGGSPTRPSDLARNVSGRLATPSTGLQHPQSVQVC